MASKKTTTSPASARLSIESDTTPLKMPSLSDLLNGLQDTLVAQLGVARRVIAHPGTKGDATEASWINMLTAHLPSRYQVSKAFVVDSAGATSHQIDIVVHDRQYSPLVFEMNGAKYVPAESVYAVFEAKQEIDAGHVAYAAEKIASVRRLKRTSIPIPYAEGVYKPKPLGRILGGLVTLESSWNPAMGDALENAIKGAPEEGRLDLGCVAAHGVFEVDYTSSEPVVTCRSNRCALALFMFRTMARLSAMATVPMLDVMAYAACLPDDETDIPRRKGGATSGSYL